MPSPPSSDTIRRALTEFQLTASDLQVEQIQQYIKLLLAWNDKINLTAIREPIDILYRHFCESMFPANKIMFQSGRLADIGSGGGFPGIPLKIMRPDLTVFLIESNAKKATFLAEVARELELANTRVLVSRYEELGEEVAPLDIVTSRAVGEFVTFLDWSGSERVGAKEVMLWIGGQDLEQVRGIDGWQWLDAIPVPQSLRRFVLVGFPADIAR
jgi:16S rRNA (guanine527-N7)-methyltransferase